MRPHGYIFAPWSSAPRPFAPGLVSGWSCPKWTILSKAKIDNRWTFRTSRYHEKGSTTEDPPWCPANLSPGSYIYSNLVSSSFIDDSSRLTLGLPIDKTYNSSSLVLTIVSVTSSTVLWLATITRIQLPPTVPDTPFTRIKERPTGLDLTQLGRMRHPIPHPGLTG